MSDGRFHIPHDNTHRLWIVLVPLLDELGKLVGRIGNIQLSRSIRRRYHLRISQVI